MPYFPLPEIQINKASYPPLVPRPSLKKAMRPLFVLFPPPSICFFRICNWLKERKNKTKPTYLKAGMRKPAYLFYTVSKYFTYVLINVPCIFLASAKIAKRAFSPGCTLELPQELKRKIKLLMTRPAPFPKFWDSDLIGQGWDLRTSNFKSSPSDSNLKPKLRSTQPAWQVACESHLCLQHSTVQPLPHLFPPTMVAQNLLSNFSYKEPQSPWQI